MMMTENENVPPPLVAGIAYNLKKGVQSEVEDIEAEYDTPDTIEAIKEVFESAGIEAVLLEADSHFFEKVKSTSVDIVFNIAEGTSGRGREAQVPAILNFLGIPFSGSDETTLAVALDKAMTKRYLSTFGIPTPLYQLINSPDFKLDPKLSFPLIIKPNSEGSSKGISDLAIADNEAELRDVIEKNLRLYHESMLVEEYVSGREFTVGILGNGEDMRVFEPMEICYLDEEHENSIYSYNVKRNYEKFIQYRCPPILDEKTISKMKEIAARIYTALECRDFSRIDFRLSQDGRPWFIEINPLPGLAPGYSDYPMLADFCGMDYRSLVLGVLNCALKRYGMREVCLNRGGRSERL
jgi:D-alanine-D-alanine ligase